MKIERILAPVDFSPSSSKALHYAIELAKHFGAVIHLFHSYPVKPDAVSPYAPYLRDDLIAAYRQAASEQLSQARQEVEAAGVAVETHLSQEYPSKAIADAAKEHQVDLIVIGTRGLSGLKHMVLGSVAERTLRIAPCPVLTVGD